MLIVGANGGHPGQSESRNPNKPKLDAWLANIEQNMGRHLRMVYKHWVSY